MSYGNSTTFWKMICSQEICIPRIQRDYVQGRKVKRIEQNRKTFVQELYSALISKNPMRLNFVYGYTNDKNAFVPIDGQQRLTTLFLLHIYLAARAKIDIYKDMSEFKYETRFSTERFFEQLLKEGILTHLVNYENVENELSSEYDALKNEYPDFDKFPDDYKKEDIEFNINYIKSLTDNKQLVKDIEAFILKRKKLKISERIKDSGWFVSSWNYDPTVVSCLSMLNEIEAQYKKIGDVNGKELIHLLKSDECPITFMCKDIEIGFGKPNELYIKMNARGKQLTDYENLKSQLYEVIDKIKLYDLTEQKNKGTFLAGVNEENLSYFEAALENYPVDISIPDDFKQKLDGDWYQYVWELFDIKQAEKYTDIILKDIIHWVFVNRIVQTYCEDFVDKKFMDNLSEILAIQNNQNSSYTAERIAEMTMKDYLELFCESALSDFLKRVYENKEKRKSKYKDPLFKYLKNEFAVTEDIKNYLFSAIIKKALFDLYSCMQNLCLFGTNKCRITQETIVETLFGKTKDNSFSNLLNRSHKARVNLFAIGKFRNSNINEMEFDEWFCTYQKLCENTIIDSPNDHRKACKDIEKYCCDKFDEDVLSQLEFFDKNQRAEEIFKMQVKKWDLTDNSWSEVIKEAESYPYFKGNIYFAFRLLLDDCPASLLCNEKLDLNFIENLKFSVLLPPSTKFKDIWNKIHNLFELIFNLQQSGEDAWLLHRALLTYGDYSIYANSARTLFFEGGKEYFTWRKLLSNTGSSFEIFKSLFCDIVNDDKDIKQKLLAICQNSIRDDWKSTDNCDPKYSITKSNARQLVEIPDILCTMKDKKFVYDKVQNRIVYYSSSTLSGKYFEANSYYLYWKLKTLNLYTDDEIYYYAGQDNFESSKEDCYISINNIKIKYNNESSEFYDIATGNNTINIAGNCIIDNGKIKI